MAYQRSRYGAQTDTVEIPEKDLQDKVRRKLNTSSFDLFVLKVWGGAVAQEGFYQNQNWFQQSGTFSGLCCHLVVVAQRRENLFLYFLLD